MVELEPEVVAANRSVAGLRRLDPLSDPRVHLRIDDARSALQLSAGRFDAIVSQPSHPWTSGSAQLFTREFYELVGARLEPKGVFVQWMGLQFVDESLLRTLVGTLAATFAHVELHQPPATGAILLMASDAPLDVEAGAERALAVAPQAFAELGVLTREDVLAGRVLDDAGCRRVAEGAPLNTDAWNRLQTGSPRALRRHVTLAEADRIFARHDVLRRPPTNADRLYLLRRLVDQGARSRALRLAVALADPAERRTAFALIDLASGHAERGQATLASLLAHGPRGKRGRLAELEGGAVSREACFALLLALRHAALGPQAPRALREWATADPAARALLAGWERVAAGEPAAVRDLETPLAVLEPRHPAFRAATRLRIAWRQSSGDPGRAREALELLEPLLGPRAPISDLLLRARLAAQAGDPAAVRASLEEMGSGRARGPAVP